MTPKYSRPPAAAKTLAVAARAQEKRRGIAAAWGNFALTILVLCLIWLQQPVDGKFLVLFLFCQFIACGLYYALPGWRDDLDASARGIADELVAKKGSNAAVEYTALERHAPRWYESLWIAVTVNLIAIWGLVYWTGGPVNSPFAILPFALIVTGQMLVRVGPIQIDGVKDLPQLLWKALLQYWTPLLAASVFYVSLFVVNANWPHRGISGAPDIEFGLVLAANLVLTTVMTYVSRAGTDEEGQSALFPQSVLDSRSS